MLKAVHALAKARQFAALSACLALAACSATSDVTVVHYKVSGKTAKEISEQISLHGPRNGHAVGVAVIRMSLGVRFSYGHDFCAIEWADVRLRITVQLPEWTELEKADSKTRADFIALREHVAWHEQQHVDIARRYEQLIEREIERLQPASSCDVLELEARAIFDRLYKRQAAEQLAFDLSERDAITKRLRAIGF